MPYILGQEARPLWETFCFFEEAFSREECEKIVTIGKAAPPKVATIGGDGNLDAQKRKTLLSWLDWNPETDFIFKKLEPLIQGANSNRFKFNLAGFLEPLQFTQYLEPDDHYDWHQDSGAKLFSIRKLSVVVQLSDPEAYKGGDLEFFLCKREKSLRKQGTVFIFPSFEVHRVTKLLEGTRYSLVAWVSGPPYA